MSHLNNQGPNQSQNSGQGYSNFKRNYNNNRGHNPNVTYNYQQNPYAASQEQYMGSYPPVFQQPYGGYVPQGYSPGGPGQPYIPQPHLQKQYPNQHHQINLTTPNGEKVDVKSLSSTAPKATLNKYTSPIPSSPSIHTKPLKASVSPSQTSAAVESPAQTSAKNSLAEQFKLQVAAKAAKAKAEAEAAKKAKDDEQKKPKSEVNQEVKAEIKEEPKAEEKVEAPKEELKQETEKEIKEEPKEELKEEVKEEPKETLKEEEPKTEPEQKQTEIKEESTPEVENDSIKEIVEEDQLESSIPETIEETTKEVKVEDPKDDVFSISKFFKKLDDAKAIEDPFALEYPEGFTSPDPKLKEAADAPKFRYDPVFLLQFAQYVKFPADEEFKEKIKFIEQSRSDRSGSSRGLSNFRGAGGSRYPLNKKLDSRSNSRQSSKRRGGGSSRNDRKSNRFRDRGDREDREDKEPELPIDVKPLEKSATRWIPRSRAAKTQEVKYAPDGVTVLLSEDEIAAKAKSLLNKLTLEYFEDISDSILEIANQSKWEDNGASVKQVLEITFDKAVDEPHWSSMYAQFCAKLCKDISPEVKDASVLDKEGNPSFGSVLVRKYLISKCQVEYEKGWSEELPTNEDGTPLEPEMMTDEYYRIAGVKRRGLGLVRLIGHLYDLGLLKEAVIIGCLQKLIKNEEDPADDIVENLIQFVKTIGMKLDQGPDTRRKMNHIFAIMKKMSEQPKIPRRLQFALLDLIDLRNNRWIGGDSDKGPKTIKEIHEEERKKQEEQRQKSERKRGGNNDSRSNSSMNSNWSNSNRVNESDFKSVGRVGSPSSSALGPLNSFTGKGKNPRQLSSNGGGSAAGNTSSPLAARENSVRAAANSFALLNDDHEDEQEDHHEEASKDEEASAEKATEEEAQE